jgi:hypothetical protein
VNRQALTHISVEPPRFRPPIDGHSPAIVAGLSNQSAPLPGSPHKLAEIRQSITFERRFSSRSRWSERPAGRTRRRIRTRCAKIPRPNVIFLFDTGSSGRKFKLCTGVRRAVSSRVERRAAGNRVRQRGQPMTTKRFRASASAAEPASAAPACLRVLAVRAGTAALETAAPSPERTCRPLRRSATLTGTRKNGSVSTRRGRLRAHRKREKDDEHRAAWVLEGDSRA